MREEQEETRPADEAGATGRAPRERQPADLWVERPDRERPAAKRPPRQRPAPVQVTAARRQAAAGTADRSAAKQPRPSRKPRELPRAWWLMACVEVTLIVIVLGDWLTGLGDPPADCSRAICTTGQGVGLLSLVGAIVIGLGVVVSFFVIAIGAAQRQPAQGRPPRQSRAPKTR